MKIRKVLVVDNDVTIVELLAVHLEEAGYQVARASDGIEALDRLEAPGSRLPDAILLDLIMPRLDGQRLTRFLKLDEQYRDIPIVILSGTAAEDGGRLLGFGADAYIAKGRIDDTIRCVLETFRWLEVRTDPAERRERVIGAEKLSPREMTRELLNIKSHLDTMLAMMREGVVEIDRGHRILYANPAACALLGAEDNQLFGKPLASCFPDAAAVERYLGRTPGEAKRRAEPIQIERDGVVMRLSFSTLAEREDYRGAILILEDVTAQLRRERSLLDLMDAIVQHAPAGLCLLDTSRSVVVANPAFARILRLPAALHLTGVPLVSCLEGTGVSADELLGTDGARGSGPRTVEFTTPGYPDQVVLSVSTSSVDSPDGRRLLLLVEDVTQKAAMERELRRTNEDLVRANRTKTTFLSMVSHELRTPLSVVRGYLSLILEGRIGPEPERVLDALRIADKRARHLQHLIEELLDLSRIAAGQLSLKREPIVVRKHVLEVVEMFRDEQERKRLAIEVAIPEGLPPAFADHDKVHQIFTNFLSNAVKFTGEGGRITVAGRERAGALEFSVSDTGIGIPAAELGRIFEKFYQVDSSDKRLYPGTGLGLAIVKMIVAALGGAVRVASEPGKGSTFTFTLPQSGAETAAPAAAPAAEEAPAPAPRAPRRRVLAVDRDADTLTMIRLLLPEERFEVIGALDAFEGLREFYRKRPDIVLADALLPVMSGLELCRVLKTNPAAWKTPVVLLSAAAQEEEIRQGYQVGADAYLVKPFSASDLLEQLRRLAG